MKSSWKSKTLQRINSSFMMLMILFAVMLCACKPGSEKSEQLHQEYTCSMHPQIVQDKPGTCPICGMALVLKSNRGDDVAVTPDLQKLTKPTNTSVVAAIETIHPERKTASANLKAVGMVTYDTRKTYAVPVRFGGRIEKLYVKYNYQSVRKGEVIMEVYSPELVTAQRELLYIVNEQNSSRELVEAAKQKLLLLGLTSRQIEKIIATGKETFTLPIVSPYNGYVVESIKAESLLPQSGRSGAGGMSESKNVGMDEAGQSTLNLSPPPPEQISIREGMYVATGQSLFNIIEGDQLWAQLSLPASEAQQIKEGDSIKLYMKDSEIFTLSRVDLVQPFFSEGKPFLQIRSYLNNRKKSFHVGQILTGQIITPQSESLWIPKRAILDLGVRQIVFLKLDGMFTAFGIKTGVESEGWIEIVSGLQESSEIAANAHYLVDSESFVKVVNP